MSALPPIDASLLPADIRNGSPDRKKSYEAALNFEQMLVQQLAKSLADTTKPDSSGSGDDGSSDATGMGGDAASSTYENMLPEALSNGIMSAGGLGLARSLVPQEPQS